MNNNYFEVFQGDITDIVYVRPKVLGPGDLVDANFSCFVSATDSTGTVIVTKRTVTEKATVSIKGKDGSYSDEECFVCYLKPTETEALTEDDNTLHDWIIEVSNTTITPVFNFELHASLKVKQQGIP